MTEREASEARFSALAALPWVRAAERPPPPHTRGRFLVPTAPVEIPGATGRLGARLHFASHEDGRWRWCGPTGLDYAHPVVEDVVAWLDAAHWELDRLAARFGGESA